MGKRTEPEKIVRVLREAEAELAGGKTIAQVIQNRGISDQTFDRLRQRYGRMRVDEAMRLKELEAENVRLKKLVADLALGLTEPDIPLRVRRPAGHRALLHREWGRLVEESRPADGRRTTHDRGEPEGRVQEVGRMGGRPAEAVTVAAGSGRAARRPMEKTAGRWSRLPPTQIPVSLRDTSARFARRHRATTASGVDLRCRPADT